MCPRLSLVESRLSRKHHSTACDWLVTGLVLASYMVSAVAAGVVAESAPATAGRPRIGLVLADGGAEGGVHVGVLKVLEELRVPIDCIAGTSMGALVGAGYASCISARKMEEFLTGRTPVSPLTPGIGATSADSWSLWLSAGRPIGHGGTIMQRGIFR